MKIYILTFQRAVNVGAALQGYALMAYLRQQGHQVQLVDYCPAWTDADRYPFKRIFENFSLKKVVWCCLKIYKNKIFEKFFNNFIAKTVEVKNLQELLNLPSPDIYITGSDQVWNYEITGGIDNAYLLNFPTDAKKISYAASSGFYDWTEEFQNKLVVSLKKYNAISVREKDLQTKLAECGIKNVQYVLDPTLLLGKEDYQKIQKTVLKGKYILLYILFEDAGLWKLADKLAKQYNCKIVDISHIRKKYSADEAKWFTGPQEFLGLIDGAEWVVTNSFHGTAFSIIYRKNFYSFKAGNRTSRITSLLNVCGLQDRFVDDAVSQTISVIDYSDKEQLIEEAIADSKEFLRKI